MEHAASQDLPRMEPVTALAFQMAESYLTPVLPQATLDLLRPYFNRAKEVLSAVPSQLKTETTQKLRGHRTTGSQTTGSHKLRGQVFTLAFHYE
ncbi:MAG: hypothetical protein L3J59_09050 [Methylococcaceae bacterium]|nr:hypothetical protein [Methylococcaceae bacterium]